MSLKESNKAPIFAISRHRMGTDGPGVTTLVTFMGCPLNCRYCLNPKCHEDIYEEDGITPRKGIMLLSPQELFDKVKIDNLYFMATGGGICFGGGEPGKYADFISDFKKLYPPSWKIYIETCLRLSREEIQTLSPVIDHWYIDMKDMNPRIYERYTRVGKCNNLKHLLDLQELVPPEKVTMKVPHIPGFNTFDDVERTVKALEGFGFEDIREVEYIKRKHHE